MTQFANAMEVFKLLDKSNCRKCGKATCLAFAGAVYTGQTSLGQCPKLDPDLLSKFESNDVRAMPREQELEEALSHLRKSISKMDLKEAAKRLDAAFINDKLIIKTLGKDFCIDSKGNISTDIHVHAWIAIPAMNYILQGGKVAPSGKWVPMRELEGGKKWYRLFGQRVEKPLKKVADTYTDLFEDMIHLFNGRQVYDHYDADIALVLHPLPRIPILICYFKPDDGLESDLNLFFDATAEENLNIESIYTLTAGLVVMFEKLAQRHGY